MKEFLTENWLTIVVCIYLMGKILYGHYKGFIRIAVSLAALILSLLIVKLGMPYVTGYLKEHTGIHQMVGEQFLRMSGFEVEPEGDGSLPAGQRRIIEQLDLPEPLKDALIENNNNEVYQLLGVEAFSAYIASYLANMVFYVLGSIVLFILSYVLIRLLIGWLDLIAKLPIIHGVNQIVGAILGGLEGLLVLWVLCLIVTFFSGTEWGRVILAQVNGSPILFFLYNINPIQRLVLGVLGKLF